jgi:ribosomal RNA-processing protein 17
MLGKRKRSAALVPPPKKRKNTSAIEEITFDFSAREDYLSGFHKRKLQRIKHAKEEAAKKDREEKITARKLVSCSSFDIISHDGTDISAN